MSSPKIHNRIIKNHILVADSFGPFPVLSLMHPKKGNEDCYSIPNWAEEQEQWLTVLLELSKLQTDVYISGLITYGKCAKSKHRVISNIEFYSMEFDSEDY